MLSKVNTYGEQQQSEPFKAVQITQTGPGEDQYLLWSLVTVIPHIT